VRAQPHGIKGKESLPVQLLLCYQDWGHLLDMNTAINTCILSTCACCCTSSTAEQDTQLCAHKLGTLQQESTTWPLLNPGAKGSIQTARGVPLPAHTSTWIQLLHKT